jgi:hypothetical protein
LKVILPGVIPLRPSPSWVKADSMQEKTGCSPTWAACFLSMLGYYPAM